jgi:hypothetical protein
MYKRNTIRKNGEMVCFHKSLTTDLFNRSYVQEEEAFSTTIREMKTASNFFKLF